MAALVGCFGLEVGRWLVAETWGTARCAAVDAVDWYGRELCGAGANTATWASC